MLLLPDDQLWAESPACRLAERATEQQVNQNLMTVVQVGVCLEATIPCSICFVFIQSWRLLSDHVVSRWLPLRVYLETSPGS